MRAVDTGAPDGDIKLEIKEPFYGKISDRVFASICSNVKLNEKEEKEIVKKFNLAINKFRKKYYSLCLTNYRNSTKHCSRKRIDFKMAFKMIEILIDNIVKG